MRKDTPDEPLVGAGIGDRTMPDALPSAPVTRFAPAPTGLLHLGHLVNALYVWGVARATGGRVVLRMEDHDRQRSRPAYERSILEDLERLGLRPDEPPAATFERPTPYRQSDIPEVYEAALGRLRQAGVVYACDCTRSTFAAWDRTHGRRWQGSGCPGRCRDRSLAEVPGLSLRVAVGNGTETWTDLLLGDRSGEPSAAGDLLVRDRSGNWTYAFCVVVDDLRHRVDLVIRGRDLVDATPVQLRLARILGRTDPPRFLHHVLVRRASGQKLSKAEGDTSLRSMLDAGRTPEELLGRAAHLAGLRTDASPIRVGDLSSLFA